MTIPKTKEKIIEEIKKRTGNAPDVTYKNYPIGDKIITLIYSNSVSSQNDINDFTFSLRINSGVTVSNLIFRPQLEIGSTATPYEPYHGAEYTITPRQQSVCYPERHQTA